MAPFLMRWSEDWVQLLLLTQHRQYGKGYDANTAIDQQQCKHFTQTGSKSLRSTAYAALKFGFWQKQKKQG
jgi:hypothetical protein